MDRRCFSFALSLAAFTIALSVGGSQIALPELSFVGSGGNTTLTCLHPSYPSANIRWIQGGPESLSDTAPDDPRLEATGSELLISLFHASELAGEYSCIVDPLEPAAQSLVSCPARVKHARIQSGFLAQPQSTTAYEGTDVVLLCTPNQSTPPADIIWMHNGQALDPESDSRQSIAPSGNLYITTVNASDTGVYRCIATNPVTHTGRRSNEASLTIQALHTDPREVPASFAVEPMDTAVVEGSKVVIECAGRGYPQPSGNWEKLHAQHLPIGAQVDGVGSLVVERVSPLHAGVYVCSLEQLNNTAVATKEVTLTVKVPPQFTATPSTQVGGQQDNISCSAASSDSLQLYVLFDGVVLQMESGVHVTIETTPTPQEVTTRTYQCLALNSLGCVSKEIKITPSGETTPTEALLKPTSEVATELLATPTLPDGGSGTVPPLLDLKTTAPFVQASAGDRHMLSCEVTGPADVAISVSWLFDGAVNLTSDPVEGVAIHMSDQEDGVVTTSLVLEPVTTAHDGLYTCHASIVGGSVELDATITVTVLATPTGTTPETTNSDIITTGHVTSTQPTTQSQTTITTTSNGDIITTGHVTSTQPTTQSQTTTTGNDVTTIRSDMTTEVPTDPVPTDGGADGRPSHPPSNLLIRQHSLTHDLTLTWEAPIHTIDPPIRGFKINWGVPGHVSMTGRSSVVFDGSAGTHSFTIPRNSYSSTSEVLVIYVWAYTIKGDGPRTEVEYSPSGVIDITTTTTEQPTPALECRVEAINSTSIRLQLPESLSEGEGSSIEVTISCEESRTVHSFTLSSPPPSGGHVISQALPGCSYSISITSTSGGRRAMCQVRTPSGQVDIKALVERFPNGSVLLTWALPPEIRNSDQLAIEVNWGQGWLPVAAGLHTPVDFEPNQQYEVQLRFHHGAWEGIVNFTVPPAPSPEDVTPHPRRSQTELALVYSVIFGSIMIGCALLVATILGLKYIQWRRREKDKVTDFREKSKEEFERMSLKRSSMNSMKSSKSTDV